MKRLEARPAFFSAVNGLTRQRNDLSVTPTKQLSTRYPTNAPTLLTAIAVVLLASTASATPPLPGTPQSGAWRMPPPGSHPAPVPSPDPASAAPTPPTEVPAQGVYGSYEAPDAVEDESDPADPPHLDVALGTLAPLSIGGQITGELPGRILLQADVGFLPAAYGSAVNAMVQGFGAYDAEYQALIDGAIRDGVVVRLAGGWRPFSGAGLELYGGYTYVGLRGSAVPSDVANVIGGAFAAAAAQQTLGEEVGLRSHLHNVHVAIGWRWVAFDHLVLRAQLGYMQTLASSSEVDIPAQPALAETATTVVDAELDDVFTTYAKLPTLGLSAGYRF